MRTTCRACDCWGPSVSRSTPKLGGGIGMSSAPTRPRSSIPGVTTCKPGAATKPMPGISAKVVDDEGNLIEPSPEYGEHASGYLVVDQPWPSMLRGIWGDPERFKETYWSRFAEQGWYFAGDGARYDLDGNIWVMGRIDDVMNVSGHRISTAEVESALVGHS